MLETVCRVVVAGRVAEEALIANGSIMLAGIMGERSVT